MKKKERIEQLTQIIEDLYINWKINKLDDHIPKHEKEITNLIFDENRKRNKEYKKMMKKLNKRKNYLKNVT